MIGKSLRRQSLRTLFFLVTVFSFSAGAQDSLSKPKLKLFDLAIFIGPALSDSPDLNHNYVTSFTSNAELKKANEGYGPPRGFYYDPGNEMHEYGISSTFRITGPKQPVLKRLQFRFSGYVSEKTFFTYNMRRSQITTLDTLYFTDPDVPPLLIDSTQNGYLTYSYSSSQVFAEAGAHFSVIMRRYFNFYTGILYGQGFSYKNEFKFEKTETYSIDAYPGQRTGKSGTLEKKESKEKEAASFSSRITVPLGLQHRFSQRRNFSPGFFLEVKPGINIYKISGGRQLNEFIVPVRGGIRLSFDRHK